MISPPIFGIKSSRFDYPVISSVVDSFYIIVLKLGDGFNKYFFAVFIELLNFWTRNGKLDKSILIEISISVFLIMREYLWYYLIPLKELFSRSYKNSTQIFQISIVIKYCL